MDTNSFIKNCDSLDKERDAQGIEGFLSRAEVRALTGLSATTIWREIRAGRFPEPVALSPNRKAFRANDIAQWVSGRSAKPLVNEARR